MGFRVLAAVEVETVAFWVMIQRKFVTDVSDKPKKCLEDAPKRWLPLRI
jgi:hypothetical protein